MATKKDTPRSASTTLSAAQRAALETVEATPLASLALVSARTVDNLVDRKLLVSSQVSRLTPRRFLLTDSGRLALAIARKKDAQRLARAAKAERLARAAK